MKYNKTKIIKLNRISKLIFLYCSLTITQWIFYSNIRNMTFCVNFYSIKANLINFFNCVDGDMRNKKIFAKN